MSRTAANRLVEARIAAGYDSSRQAADAFGWVYVTYNAHENGSRGIRAPVAEKYGVAYQVPTEWLLFGVGTGPQSGANGSPQPRRGSSGDLPADIDDAVLDHLLRAALLYLTPKKLSEKRLAADIKQGVVDIIGFTNTAPSSDKRDSRVSRFHQSFERVLANILRDHGVRHVDLLQAQHVALAASAFLAEALAPDHLSAKRETG